MKFKVYAIRDVYTGFLTPTFDLNDQSARRNFEHAMQNKASLFHSHPKDFDLYCVGSFDAETGELDMLVPIQLVCSGASIVEEVKSVWAG